MCFWPAAKLCISLSFYSCFNRVLQWQIQEFWRENFLHWFPFFVYNYIINYKAPIGPHMYLFTCLHSPGISLKPLWQFLYIYEKLGTYFCFGQKLNFWYSLFMNEFSNLSDIFCSFNDIPVVFFLYNSEVLFFSVKRQWLTVILLF